MSQYDLVLTQNIHVSSTEFTEKYVNISKGGLLSANTTQVPTVLAGGTDGYMLVRDDAEVTGLKWIPIGASHTQNTDTGTTSTVFHLDSDGYSVEITAESASKLGIKVDGGATYADLQAKDATFAKVTVSAAPSAGTDLTNKTYVDALLGTNSAVVYKGTIGTGGTHTIAEFNALTTYSAGWQYRVITAGTIWGNICVIGDTILTIVSRTGTNNENADFMVIPANDDTLVSGPASVTSGYAVLFDGITGKLIKAGTGPLGTMAYATATDYVANSLFDAHSILYATSDNTPVALAVGASTIVGRQSAGNIVAMTPAEAMNVLWVSAPATKTSTGIAGQFAKDANFLYACTATNVWARVPISTNW
jgi:hypothetical protein